MLQLCLNADVGVCLDGGLEQVVEGLDVHGADDPRARMGVDGGEADKGDPIKTRTARKKRKKKKKKEKKRKKKKKETRSSRRTQTK